MICPEKIEIIELLYVCENYGILGGNFLVCPEIFLWPLPAPFLARPQFWGEILGRAN
jgi:hypothetical protein